MTTKKTTVRISRLVVEAASEAEGREVARAIRSELERGGVAAGATPAAGGGGRVEAPGSSLLLPAGSPAREIGASVARTVWRTSREAARDKETR